MTRVVAFDPAVALGNADYAALVADGRNDVSCRTEIGGNIRQMSLNKANE